MRIEIYGSSDDNLCCTGDFEDQFSAWNRPVFLHFANGTVIEAQHCPPDEPYMLWRIRPAHISDGVEIERVELWRTDEGGDNRLIVTGESLDVVGCFADVAGPTNEEFEGFLQGFDTRHLSPGDRLRLIRAMKECDA